jgi:hypothetical protein
LRTQPFLGRDEVSAVLHVQAIGVGPVFMNTAPRIGPVVIDLTAEQVAANAPHVFVFAPGRSDIRGR